MACRHTSFPTTCWICLSLLPPPGPHLTSLGSFSSPQAPDICCLLLWSLESCYNFSDFSFPLNPWRKTPFLLGRPIQSSFVSSMVINIYLYGRFVSHTYLFTRTYWQRGTCGTPVLLKIAGHPFHQPLPTISHSHYWHLSFPVK